MGLRPIPPTEFESASVLQRFAAQIIDSLVIGGLLLAPAFADALMRQVSSEIALPAAVTGAWRWAPAMLSFPIALMYRLIGDGIFKGAALGKRVMRIYVADIGSRRACSVGQAAIRMGVLIIPFTWLIEPVILACDGQLRWGDHVAHTCVLRRKPKPQPTPAASVRPLKLETLSETLQKLKNPPEGG